MAYRKLRCESCGGYECACSQQNREYEANMPSCALNAIWRRHFISLLKCMEARGSFCHAEVCELERRIKTSWSIEEVLIILAEMQQRACCMPPAMPIVIPITTPARGEKAFIWTAAVNGVVDGFGLSFYPPIQTGAENDFNFSLILQNDNSENVLLTGSLTTGGRRFYSKFSPAFGISAGEMLFLRPNILPSAMPSQLTTTLMFRPTL